MAQELGLPEARVIGTYYAGIVHDLGKISVPSEILAMPTKLCEEAMGMTRSPSAIQTRSPLALHADKVRYAAQIAEFNLTWFW
jgi:response regulator RpfG family c-di-GMP phosphodiesterase